VAALLSAIATIAIAVATAVYVLYTRRLWEQTLQSNAHHLANLELVKDQLRLTIEDFRKRVRPYLACSLNLEWRTQFTRLRVEPVLRNVGSVPACVQNFHIGAFAAAAQFHDQRRLDIHPIVFPKDEVRVLPTDVDLPEGTVERRIRLLIRVTVEYAGPGGGDSYVTVEEVTREEEIGLFRTSGGSVT
jgi:hypothetical protein